MIQLILFTSFPVKSFQKKLGKDKALREFNPQFKNKSCKDGQKRPVSEGSGASYHQAITFF